MAVRVLVLSNTDDLLIVDALIEKLADEFELYAWTEDVFTLSASPLESLAKVVQTVDCAIFVVRREKGRVSPNLVSEIGFCVGYLGQNRIGVVSNATTAQTLSDLRESSQFIMSGRGESLSEAEVGELAAAIRKWIKTLGRRRFRVSNHPAPNELLARKGSLRCRARVSKKSASRGVGVFISYSHADAAWLARIKTMLSPLLRGGMLDLWDDTRIKPGSKWRLEIREAIDKARVAILLVSAPFLASPFIADKELPPLLRAARRDGLTILWVYVSACLYRNTPIAQYQAAHAIAKPLEALTKAKRNQALLDIADSVAASLKVQRQPRRRS